MADQLEESKAWGEEIEPWEPWETRLCLWSLGIGIGSLVILGVLVNIFLL